MFSCNLSRVQKVLQGRGVGMVLSGKSPWACIVEYSLFSICSEKEKNLSHKIPLVK